MTMEVFQGGRDRLAIGQGSFDMAVNDVNGQREAEVIRVVMPFFYVVSDEALSNHIPSHQ